MVNIIFLLIKIKIRKNIKNVSFKSFSYNTNRDMLWNSVYIPEEFT